MFDENNAPPSPLKAHMGFLFAKYIPYAFAILIPIDAHVVGECHEFVGLISKYFPIAHQLLPTSVVTLTFWFRLLYTCEDA